MVQSVAQRTASEWRPRGGNTLRVADGSRLTVAGVDDLMAQPWYSDVRWRVQSVGASEDARSIRMVQIGPAGSGDRMVQGMLRGEYTAEYSSRGGTIALAATADRSQGFVVWRGKWHEVYGWVNVPDAPHSAYLDVLAGLAFTDHPEGLTLRLTTPGAVFDRITVTKWLPEVGLVQFNRAETAAADLPRWSGRRVRSGELWKQTLPEDAVGRASVLVHLSPEVVTVVHPEGGGSDTAPALGVLERLESVRWA